MKFLPSSSCSFMRLLAALLVGLVLAACSSSPTKPKPAELPPGANLIGVRQAWMLKLDGMDFPVQPRVVGDRVALASGAGTVLILAGDTGTPIWRLDLQTPVSAGVGFDGKRAAVVTRSNDLVVVEDGQVLWRQRLAASTLTPPLVAGERVFVLGGDRSVTAFDGRSGRRIWQQQRAGEALLLRQAGLLTAVGDTLVVGLSGKMVGMNPLNGSARWEVPIASPRGVNDIERLVDLIAGGSREAGVVCARAFQAAVGCVDTSRGNLVWSKPANGATGLSGNPQTVFGVEVDGTVLAWRRSDGERLWSQEVLRYRGLGNPLVAGRSVVVGDAGGLLHFLSREDGSPLARMNTDGSAIEAAPVLAGNTLVVVTRSGGVYGFQPE